MKLTCRIFVAVVMLLVIFEASDAKRRKSQKAMILRQKETNAIDFIRLAVMRAIYGVATRLGFGEQISGALNGAFVPPGAEDYDGEGFGLFDREDDDYDY